MSAANTTVITGNLTSTPELQVTASEIPFVRLRVAVNRRTFNQEQRSWEDKQDGFYSVVVWRDPARHCAASLKKGDRVVVLGRLVHHEWETPPAVEGGQPGRAQKVEIEAEEVGCSLRWDAWSKVTTRELNKVLGIPHAGADRAEEALAGEGEAPEEGQTPDRPAVTAAA